MLIQVELENLKHLEVCFLNDLFESCVDEQNRDFLDLTRTKGHSRTTPKSATAKLDKKYVVGFCNWVHPTTAFTIKMLPANTESQQLYADQTSVCSKSIRTRMLKSRSSGTFGDATLAASIQGRLAGKAFNNEQGAYLRSRPLDQPVKNKLHVQLAKELNGFR